MNKQQIIDQLQLEPHLEGGYFRRTFASDHEINPGSSQTRPGMSSIYYLLTDDRPVGHFHRNRSDIMHYWHQGHSLTYYLIEADGSLRTVVLGPNLEQGEQLQLLVPGGIWKATHLPTGEFGLLSEAVCPGFEYEDMELASAELLANAFPSLWQQQRFLLEPLCKG